MIKTTTQTGKAIKATQVIVPEWMERGIEDGGGNDALFAVTREHTAFGTFIIGFEPVT
jgi:hypothetical protein